MEKEYQTSVGISLPKEFVNLIDEIIKLNPDFKNRTGVIRYAVRRYYDEVISKDLKTNDDKSE